jgi:hypothetical protein
VPENKFLRFYFIYRAAIVPENKLQNFIMHTNFSCRATIVPEIRLDKIFIFIPISNKVIAQAKKTINTDSYNSQEASTEAITEHERGNR